MIIAHYSFYDTGTFMLAWETLAKIAELHGCKDRDDMKMSGSGFESKGRLTLCVKTCLDDTPIYHVEIDDGVVRKLQPKAAAPAPEPDSKPARRPRARRAA